MNFTRKNIDAYYFTQPGFYLLHIPVKVAYKEIYAAAQVADLRLKEKAGPILESSRFFGRGWIGIEVDKPMSRRDDIVRIQGNFEVAEHRGPYRTIGKTYQLVRKERPQAKEFYNLYLDDPAKAPAAELRTHILFR